MSELVDDDVVSEFLWEAHELDIETDGISMTTAPPSGLLVSTGDMRILKSQSLSKYSCSLRECFFCSPREVFELQTSEWYVGSLFFSLLLYPVDIFLHKRINDIFRCPHRRVHDNSSLRLHSQTHTTKFWNTDESIDDHRVLSLLGLLSNLVIKNPPLLFFLFYLFFDSIPDFLHEWVILVESSRFLQFFCFFPDFMSFAHISFEISFDIIGHPLSEFSHCSCTDTIHINQSLVVEAIDE